MATDSTKAEERTRLAGLALVGLITASVLSPDIGMPGDLPAIRLEQLLLAAVIPLLVWVAAGNSGVRKLTAVDGAFAAVAAATTLSIVFAPFVVNDSARSARDIFEVARVAEYWLLFRVGLAAGSWRGTPVPVLGLIAVVATAEAMFSVVQYLHPGNFNFDVTTVWTEENNLLALERRGRVIGTIGNANYYGIFAGFTLLVGAAWMVARPATRQAQMLAAGAVVASSVSLVLTQSRTAASAVLVGIVVLAVGFLATDRSRRGGPAVVTGLAVLASVTGAALFMLAVPPRFGGITERFNLAVILDDPAVTTRLSKWRSLWERGHDDVGPGACDSPGIEDIAVPPAHTVAGTTGADAASPDAIARDARRKQDVSALYRAILDYRCRHQAWPMAEGLDAALVPEFLVALPGDPATGAPYAAFFHEAGFMVAAHLENAADPSGPVYAVGTIPNVIVNPSFEEGDSRPSSWSTIGPARVGTTADGPLFGRRAAALELRLGTTDGSIAGLRQTVPAAIYAGAPYVAAAWARGTTPDQQDLQMHLIAITEDGTQWESFASRNFILESGGKWQRLEVPFMTPAAPRIIELRLFFLAPYATGTLAVDIDAVTLTLGEFAPSFPFVRDEDPAATAIVHEPGFADSPIIGVGPNKATATTFDNEYAVFLDRYGVIGTLAYLGLWAATAWLAFRSARSATGAGLALALGVAASTAALLVFNFAAGGYYDFQLMGIFWPLAGLAAGLAAKPGTPGQRS